MNNTHIDFEDIFNRYKISPEDRQHFMLLINTGKINSDAFSRRLAARRSYKAVCRDAMRLLSRPYQHLFA